MAHRDELVLAHLAGKGTLTRVCSHVRLKVTCFREFLKTTLVRTEKNLLLVLRP